MNEVREKLRREISEEYESRYKNQIEEYRNLVQKDLRLSLESQIRKDLEQEYVTKLEREAQARLNLQGDLLQRVKSEEQKRLIEEHRIAISQIEQSLNLERSNWNQKWTDSIVRQEGLEKAIIALKQDNVAEAYIRKD